MINNWKIIGKSTKPGYFLCLCPLCGKEKNKSKPLMKRFSSCGCSRHRPIGSYVKDWKILGEPINGRYPTACPHCNSPREKSFSEMSRAISCGCQNTKYQVGETVNGWKILEFIPGSLVTPKSKYKVKCPHCENTRDKIVTDIGANSSCGCLKNHLKIGDVVSGWTIVGPSQKPSHHLAKCPHCNNTREKTKGGLQTTASCGCMLSELKGLSPGTIVNGWILSAYILIIVV